MHRTHIAVIACSVIMICTDLGSSGWAQQPNAPTDATLKNDGEAAGFAAGQLAPALSGLTGLLRTITTDIGPPHSFSIALYSEIFTGRGFLVGEKNATADTRDDHTRYSGTLSLAYTPLRFAEFFLNVNSSANRNQRSETGRQDEELILALGDFSFGGKGQYPLLPFLSLGGHLALTLLNSVGGVSLDSESASFYAGMISTFDLNPLTPIDLPLRLHLNAGYQLDNSQNLADFAGYGSTSLQVEKFSMGIHPSRVKLRFGIDAALRRWTRIGVTPIAELAMDIATGNADPDFAATKIQSQLPQDQLEGRVSFWITAGVRVNPLRGLNLTLGTDIGLIDPGFFHGPPVMPWNLVLGLGYTYDSQVQVKYVTETKNVVQTAAQPMGKIRGRVLDALTLEPIEGAVVSFPGKDLTGLSTEPDGSFLSYPLLQGDHALMARHPNYLAQKTTAKVTLDALTTLDIRLQPAPPKVGTLSGRIQDLEGNGLSATIELSGATEQRLTTAGSGAYTVEISPGSYVMKIAADGYLRKEKALAITAGEKYTVDLSLSPRPKRSLVKLTRRAIVIHRQVHFSTGTATIMPDSRQLLDSVVDLLITNPQIKRVEVAGHTDDRGGQELNMRLSQARADAVVEYLVKNGLESERLIARGYGPGQPKVPNLTPQNRATNRRVEFTILVQE